MGTVSSWMSASLAASLLLACAPSGASDSPPPSPVIDRADIFPIADETRLATHLQDYSARTKIVIVVASTPSLDGQDIDHYATEMFNTLGIGDARTNEGLLVLVAPNERKVRIEVGCGLEAAITNPVAKQIIENDMLPSYRQGALAQGTLAGVNALEMQLEATKARGPISKVCKDMMKRHAA